MTDEEQWAFDEGKKAAKKINSALNYPLTLMVKEYQRGYIVGLLDLLYIPKEDRDFRCIHSSEEKNEQ